jgi:hypothetical protein
MGKKQRLGIADNLASVPELEPRVILATGSYIGEASMMHGWIRYS